MLWVLGPSARAAYLCATRHLGLLLGCLIAHRHAAIVCTYVSMTTYTQEYQVVCHVNSYVHTYIYMHIRSYVRTRVRIII